MKKCDWCGRYYSPSGMLAKDAEHLGDLADKAGLGLVTSLGGGLMRLGGKRNFCSEECKQNYMAAHQGSGGSGGVATGAVAELRLRKLPRVQKRLPRTGRRPLQCGQRQNRQGRITRLLYNQ